jgi:quinol monooxygenase YgiN
LAALLAVHDRRWLELRQAHRPGLRTIMTKRFVQTFVVLGVCATGSARADGPGDAVYTASYFEVAPRAISEAVALLKEYRKAAAREEGRVGVDALQQIGRLDHFAILEGWKSQQAFDTLTIAEPARRLRERLQAISLAPYDQRLLKPPPAGASEPRGTTRRAIYVLTHADAVPPIPAAVAALDPLAEASRREPGNLRFDVLPQANRQNHFTIVEVWQDERAHDAHAAAAHTKEFREKFQKVSGSLYDERLYKALE